VLRRPKKEDNMPLVVPLRKEEDFERAIGVIKKFDFARMSARGITQRKCYPLLQLQTFSGVMFSHILRFRPPKEVRLVTSKVPTRMKFPKVTCAGFNAI